MAMKLLLVSFFAFSANHDPLGNKIMLWFFGFLYLPEGRSPFGRVLPFSGTAKKKLSSPKDIDKMRSASFNIGSKKE
ncbi:MAG: hypothetical protein K9K64_15535 [Desulfohalobiaceae bacterium]|nr:hypothetical protein [Desulfohalobiaceae bacterium]